MDDSSVYTLRNTFFLCSTLRKKWDSGSVKEKILLNEKFSGLELGYWASPCARASANTVAIVCDSLNEEVLRSGNSVQPRPASLRLWDLMDEDKVSKQIHYESLSYHAHFVLDNFVVVIGRMNEVDPRSMSLLDMMVVSIKDQEILFTKERVFDMGDFMRGFEKDSRVFKNTIASIRQKTITLHEVGKEDLTLRVLDVEEVVGRGMFQYSKFMTWDETYLAHPFQSLGLQMVEVPDALVEHTIFCWDQEDDWRRKEFRVPPSRVNDIHYDLAVHQGKLFALQGRTTRVWQISSGDLLSTATLTDTTPALSSFPNLAFNANPSGFLITDGVGLHLQPQLGLVVGLLTSGHSPVSCRTVYVVVVFTLDWQFAGSIVVPEEKDLQQLDLYLVGPRLVLLYNDNSYSVLDLETFSWDPNDWKTFAEPKRLAVFPLGTAKKEGTIVSQRTLHSRMRGSADDQDGVYTVNCVNSVSDVNIVVGHVNQGRRFIQSFSFL